MKAYAIDVIGFLTVVLAWAWVVWVTLALRALMRRQKVLVDRIGAFRRGQKPILKPLPHWRVLRDDEVYGLVERSARELPVLVLDNDNEG